MYRIYVVLQVGVLVSLIAGAFYSIKAENLCEAKGYKEVLSFNLKSVRCAVPLNKLDIKDYNF